MKHFWIGFEKRSSPKFNQEDLSSHKGIAAVIRNKDGHVLVQKHNKFNFWTIPVGKVQQNESVHKGLRTELFEETGIKPIRPKLIGRETKVYQRDGRDVAVDLHVFEIPKYHGVPENLEPHKHSEQVFMPIDVLRKKRRLSDATKLFLRSIDSK